jgi:hypothetical protein
VTAAFLAAPALRFWGTVAIFAALGPALAFVALVLFTAFACVFLPADCSAIGTRPGQLVLGLLIHAYRGCLLLALVVGAGTAAVAHRLGRIPGWLAFVLVPAAIFAVGVPLRSMRLGYLAEIPVKASAHPLNFAATVIAAVIAAQVCRRVVLPLYREPSIARGRGFDQGN